MAIDAEVDEFSKAMYVAAWMEFPPSNRLSEGNRQLTQTLRSKHEQAINLLTASRILSPCVFRRS